MNKPRAIGVLAPPLAHNRLRHSFFVLRETPCPYLPGRMERKLVTELVGRGMASAYGGLSRGGFRRSHLFAYRPACRGCAACVAVRVVADAYKPSKSMRRLVRKNSDLTPILRHPEASYEQFLLFARYLRMRHPDGEMARMTFEDFRAMVEETAVDTQLAEFRDPQGRLLAVCLLDWLDDGASAVYSFFEPEAAQRGLGSYMIHWLIGEALGRGLPYVYLGYWIAGSPKMAYKARFKPLEGLGPKGWRRLFDTDS